MRHLRILIIAIAWLFTSSASFAGGALTFQLNTDTTVNSGEPQSWMNRFSDWPANHPLAADGSAVPSDAGAVVVTTRRTSTDLVLRFTIPDGTHRKPDGTTLTIGDKVIVEIDPNLSRGTELEVGADFRYEIVIKDDLISSQDRRTRDSAALNAWGVRTAMTSSGTIGFATLTAAGSAYSLTLTIPLSSLGNPSTDIGLAFLVLNDLGNTHDVGGTSVTDLTAVTFPFGDMPASNDPFLDPGVLPSVSAGGPWIQPNHWGVGLFNPPSQGPAVLTLSHSPSQYFSTSIKLSVCNVGRWEDIQPADTSGNQLALAGWYKYERAAPCKMGVWVKATNSSTTSSATARLLVLWADAGLSANTWRVIELTNPISFGPDESVSHTVWDQVPAQGSVPGGSTHPCLKVYLLPAVLNSTDPNTGILQDAATIGAINDGNKLAAFERAYGFGNPWGNQVAQMNFTALLNGTCSTPMCTQPVVGQNFDLENRMNALFGIPSASAQPVGGRELRATPVQSDFNSDVPRVKDPWFGVVIQGFALPAAKPTVPYVFLESVGGLGWAVPYTMVAEKELALGFDITNPPLLYRDLQTKPMREISAPKRRILLTTSVNAPDGLPTPKITVPLTILDGLDPGQTVRASATIAQTAGGSTLPAWWLCLLAGNVWCWLVLFLLAAIVVILATLLRRRWAH
jgi:hypothetical protein